MEQSIQEWTKLNLWMLKNLKGYGLFNFLKAVFHKFYLLHSSILCPKCKENNFHFVCNDSVTREYL